MCVTESISNLEKLTLDEIKKVNEMCISFDKLTEETKKQVGGMLSQLKEPITTAINYFKVLSKEALIQATPELLKNLKDFINAKEEVSKLEEENKEVPIAYIPPSYVPPASTGNEEDEYNLEENKEEEEYNIGEGGLDDFMTSLKKEDKTEMPPATTAKVGETKAPPALRQSVAAKPKNERALENDNEILGFVQANESRPKGGPDEFDKLFGGEDESSTTVTRPPAPVTANIAQSRPAPVPGPAYAYAPQSQPTPDPYSKFASYYATYQQPTPAPAPRPTAPMYYNQAPPRPAQAVPPQNAYNPFAETESKYSKPNPGEEGGNDSW